MPNIQNLGQLLKEAGVKGASPGPRDRKELLQELLQMSAAQKNESGNAHQAMDRLPDSFTALRNCTHGEDFLQTLGGLLKASPDIFDIHAIRGLSQLAHSLRDGLQGGRRKSFDKLVIPVLLQVKEKSTSSAIVASLAGELRKKGCF